VSKTIEIKVRVEVDDGVEESSLKQAISSIGKSPKVRVKWVRTQEIQPVGRPNEIDARILEYLLSVPKKKSALQISRYLKVPQTSLYKPLHRLVNKGQLEQEYDDRWKVQRYGKVTDVQQG
jgi:DNA-binding transcriptional ArsR family regulator